MYRCFCIKYIVQSLFYLRFSGKLCLYFLILKIFYHDKNHLKNIKDLNLTFLYSPGNILEKELNFAENILKKVMRTINIQERIFFNTS